MGLVIIHDFGFAEGTMDTTGTDVSTFGVIERWEVFGTRCSADYLRVREWVSAQGDGCLLVDQVGFAVWIGCVVGDAVTVCVRCGLGLAHIRVPGVAVVVLVRRFVCPSDLV